MYFYINLFLFISDNKNISESGMRLAFEYLYRLIHLKKLELSIK